MNHPKDDGAKPTENSARAGEDFREWADQVAQSIVDGLNAAVIAEAQKEALEKAKPSAASEKEMVKIPADLMHAFKKPDF